MTERASYYDEDEEGGFARLTEDGKAVVKWL